MTEADEHAAMPDFPRALSRDTGEDPIAGWVFAYLAAPTLIFWCAFAAPVVGWPIAAGLLFCTAWLATTTAPRQGGVRTWPWAVFFALMLLFIAGFPDGPFAWDWFKHWALLNLLADSQWPVHVVLEGEDWSLRYYVGAYLVPALIHKVWPLIPVRICLAAWLGLGFALLLSVVARRAGVRSTLQAGAAMLVVLLLGGADFFAGTAWRAATGMGVQGVLGMHHEWWLHHLSGVPLQYSAMTTALLWAPNQAIATFLVATLLSDGDRVRTPWCALCSYCLLALWSPLGMIGLLPLALYTAFRIVRVGLRARAAWGALGASAASGFGIAWYLATDPPVTGLAIAGLSQRLAGAGNVFLFLLIELGPLTLLLRSRMVADPTLRLCAATLLVIPFIGGETPDFVMRASLGPLFVLAVFAVRSVVEAVRRRRGQQLAVLAALVLCAPTAISEVAFHLQAGSAIESSHPDDPARTSRWRAFAGSPEVDLRQFLDACGWSYLPQYFSRRPSPILADPR